jgi:hypothetical protein
VNRIWRETRNWRPVSIDKEVQNRRFAIGRPRRGNLLLIASLIVFWAGVILKFVSRGAPNDSGDPFDLSPATVSRQ